MGSLFGSCTLGFDGGGAQVEVLYSSRSNTDVYGSPTRLLVSMHEVKYGLVGREVLDL